MSDLSEDIAIKVDGISKNFALPHEKVNSVKGHLTRLFSGSRSVEVQHALKDVSFEIKKGEFFGIVGRNGSGKSTLLKILAGIYQPTKGRVKTVGKLVPFIELGVGFNPELTGRENVYLNGALLGFSKKEMDDQYDEIVDFAELEEFMDQKLKNYSSGMQVRLAFSIAIKAEADILLLDEVLAVGDANFQRKCFEYFNLLKNDQRTAILVTHDMATVERYCDRAMLINEGRLITTGKPAKITKQYSDLNLDRSAEKLEKKSKKPKKGSGNVTVETKISSTGQAYAIDAGRDQSLRLRFYIESDIEIPEARLGIIINNGNNVPVFATNTSVDEKNFALEPNFMQEVDLEIDNIFANGEYKIAVTLRNDDGTIIYFSDDESARFVAGGRKHEFAVTSPKHKLIISSKNR